MNLAAKLASKLWYDAGMRVEHVLETCLYVNDLEAAERFYTRVLGLAPREKHTPRHLFFRCGERMLLLFNPDESELPSDLPPHGARGAGHVAFGVQEAEIPSWRAHLAANDVAVEKEFVWPGGQVSLYFRDPAGNLLELVSPTLWGLPELHS